MPSDFGAVSVSLDQLQALTDAATAGEWEALDLDGDFPWVGVTEKDGQICPVADDIHECADAEFIAASRAAMPALLAIARAAETLVDAPFGSLVARDFYALREAVTRLGGETT